VSRRLKRNNLQLQPGKCEFLRKEVTFIGHKISVRGVEPDNRKIEAIMNFPRPNTAKELKSFLGLAGYHRRFVPQFSKVGVPLHKLQKKLGKIFVGRGPRNRVQQTKQKLTSKPILQYPDFLRRIHTEHRRVK
jgi:hypothetical protein